MFYYECFTLDKDNKHTECESYIAFKFSDSKIPYNRPKFLFLFTSQKCAFVSRSRRQRHKRKWTRGNGEWGHVSSILLDETYVLMLIK